MDYPELVTVLIADDDEPLAELVGEHFEREFPEIETLVSTTVDEAFEIFQEESVDAIVSDYDFRAQEQDGLDFLERVRQVDPEFPFILFTGKGGEEIAERATNNNVTTYIRKQTGVSQYSVLANTVRQAIRGHKATVQNRRRLSALEASREGICILRKDGSIEYANKSFLSMYEYDKKELIGKSWRELHPESAIKTFQEEIMPQLKEKGCWQGDTLGIREDGETFEENKYIVALDDGGIVIVTREKGEGMPTPETPQEVESLVSNQD